MTERDPMPLFFDYGTSCQKFSLGDFAQWTLFTTEKNIFDLSCFWTESWYVIFWRRCSEKATKSRDVIENYSRFAVCSDSEWAIIRRDFHCVKYVETRRKIKAFQCPLSLIRVWRTDPLNSHMMTPMLYAGCGLRLLMLVTMMLRNIGVSLMRDIWQSWACFYDPIT